MKPEIFKLLENLEENQKNGEIKITNFPLFIDSWKTEYIDFDIALLHLKRVVNKLCEMEKKHTFHFKERGVFSSDLVDANDFLKEIGHIKKSILDNE